MPSSPATTAADQRLLDELTALASQAAAAILAISPSALATRKKPDRSPVTAADEAAESIILEGLLRLLPGVAVVSEEAVARSGSPPLGADFCLVDPLDGTKEFLDGRREFTVNIAFVVDRVPRLGVVAAPALGVFWRGATESGAERLRLRPGAEPSAARDLTPLRTRSAPDRIIAMVSRSHLDGMTAAFVEGLPISERVACGSNVKFCRIAEGAADVYPRFGRTCEWDVAAGHAVLAAAGGVVTTPQGQPITYGHTETNFAIPGFLAWGDRNAASRFPAGS